MRLEETWRILQNNWSSFDQRIIFKSLARIRWKIQNLNFVWMNSSAQQEKLQLLNEFPLQYVIMYQQNIAKYKLIPPIISWIEPFIYSRRMLGIECCVCLSVIHINLLLELKCYRKLLYKMSIDADANEWMLPYDVLAIPFEF